MMTGISAFVAVFIVASTFAFTVAQRRRDLALLRLIGASRRQVRRLMFGEALVLGTIGSAVGILLGVVVAPVEVRLLGTPGLVPADFHAEWRSWIVAVSLAVGIVISVAGSFGATRRAARVRPLDGLHAVSGDRVMTVSRWAIGLISSAGVIAMIAAATAMGGTSAMNMSVGIALVAVIALSALSPTVVPLVNRLVRVFSRLLFPRSKLGELVHANVGDGVRRSASTAAPIILLVGLVVGMAGAIGVMTAGAEQDAEKTVDADLVVTTSYSHRRPVVRCPARRGRRRGEPRPGRGPGALDERLIVLRGGARGRGRPDQLPADAPRDRHRRRPGRPEGGGCRHRHRLRLRAPCPGRRCRDDPRRRRRARPAGGGGSAVDTQRSGGPAA